MKSGATSDRFAKPGSHSFSLLDSYRSLNALAESIIGLFKTELICRKGPWRGLDAVELATLEWVDWYNNRRLFESIGDIPPAEAEANYYRTNPPSDKPADGRTQPPMNRGSSVFVKLLFGRSRVGDGGFGK